LAIADFNDKENEKLESNASNDSDTGLLLLISSLSVIHTAVVGLFRGGGKIFWQIV